MSRIQKIFDKCFRIMEKENIPIAKNIDRTIKINNRYKSTLATCSLVEKQYIIEINGHILKTNTKTLEEILLHELIHTIKGCFNHGTKFKQYCKQLNNKYGYDINTSSPADKITFTNMNIYNYQCPCCKRQYVAYKKPSNKLRLCSCGHCFSLHM